MRIPIWLLCGCSGSPPAPGVTSGGGNAGRTRKGEQAPSSADEPKFKIANNSYSHNEETAQGLSQLGDVMRACSGVAGSSYHQLGRIVAILADHFKVAYVSASVLSATRITCLPVAAGGRLGRSCPLGLPHFLDASTASALYRVTAGGQAQRFLRMRAAPGCGPLPPDWAALAESTGLTDFVAAVITLGSEPVAVLTLADTQPDRFSSPMWRTSLELVCASLGHLFRDRSLGGVAGAAEQLTAVDCLEELVRRLSRVVVMRLHSEELCQTRFTCRVSVIADDASCAIIFDEALPFPSIVPSTADDAALFAAHAAAAHAAGGGGSNAPSAGAMSRAMLRSSLAQQQYYGGGGGGGGLASVSRLPSGTQEGMPGSLVEGAAPGGSPLGAYLGTPRGRLARSSLVCPSPTDPHAAALMLQYSVQMTSMANLVPDPREEATHGSGDHAAAAQAGTSTTQDALTNRDTSGPCAASAAHAVDAAGEPAAALAGLSQPHPRSGPRLLSGPLAGGMMGSPFLHPTTHLQPQPPLLAGPGTGPGRFASVSQPASLMGDVREAGAWGGADPGLASNFSHPQLLQVEGQAYLVENTLLSEAIRNRAGVWIGDCVAFMQNPANPNADVFLAASSEATTAMLLSVMWERDRGHTGPGQAGPGGGRGRRSERTVTGRTVSSGVLQIAAAAAAAASAGKPAAAAANRISASTVQHTDGSAAASAADKGAAVGVSGGASGGAGAGDLSRRASYLTATSALSAAAGHGTPRPLLACYLMTSGPATPAVLQDLLVRLRELLSCLEPLVAAKLADDLAEEWGALQAGVLDRAAVAAQARNQTVLLPQRATLAQLASTAHTQHQSQGSTDDHAILAEFHPSASSPRAPTPPARRPTYGGAGGGALGGEGGGGGRGLPIPGGDGRPCGDRLGAGASSWTGRPRTPSFTISRSYTGKRMSALISGVQDRVQAAQRASTSYTTLFSRPDDLRSVVMLDKIGSGGFGTVYLGSYQATEVAVKVIIERDSETEVMRNAMELAVLSTLSHPNIVQVLTFFTDVTVQIPPVSARLAGTAPPIVLLPHVPHDPSAHGPPPPHHQHHQHHQQPSSPRPDPSPRHQHHQQEPSSPRELAQPPASPIAPLLGPHHLLDALPLSSAAESGGFLASEGVVVTAAGLAGALASASGRAGGGMAAALGSVGDVAGGVEFAALRGWLGSVSPVGTIAAAAGGPRVPRVLAPRQGAAALGSGAEGAAPVVPARKQVLPHPAPASPPSPAPAPAPPPPPADKKALVILMEFCDGGCLADAIRGGVFREKVKGGYGALQPAWAPIYLTLLEVALALRYLHSLHLVHRDLKPQNVLLKSSPSDVRGFTAKLSDFGLVKLLNEADHLAAAAAPSTLRRRRRYSGTITHVAPEGTQPGVAVDVAADIYAFGIMMWEVLTGQPVFMGLTSDQIIERVGAGFRPNFPPDTPHEYSSLAHSCWDADPRKRPAAEELVALLSALSRTARERGAAAAGGPGGPGGCGLAAQAARRRLSTLSNRELLRNVANANAAAAAGMVLGLGGGGGGGGGGYGAANLPLTPLVPRGSDRRHNEDDFPLHIL